MKLISEKSFFFLEIQNEFGSFSNYIWAYVANLPILIPRKTLQEIPCKTPLSEKIAKDLKKRGMSFVGPKIIYSFMQAVGLVNDHLETCANS